MPKKEKNLAFNKAPRANDHRGVILFVFILVLLGAAAVAFVFIFDAHYQDRIYPGTVIGSHEIGGMTFEAARPIIQETVNDIIDEGIQFTYQDQRFVLPSTIEDEANPELSVRLVQFDVDKTLNTLAAIQRQQNEAEHIYYWLAGYRLMPVFEIDKEALQIVLQQQLGSYEQPAIDAQLVIDEAGQVSIKGEKSGQAFDYSDIIQRVDKHLARLAPEPVTVELAADYPDIQQQKAQLVIPLVKQILEAAPFTLVYEDYAWLIDQDQLRQWLQLQIDSDGEVIVGLDSESESLNEYFSSMAGTINVETREAKFAMDNGKVVEFQPSQKGRTMQVKESIQQASQKIRQIGISEIDLVVEETEPEMSTDEVNDMGIEELIGQGSSNFSGSPANRRHNISVGANTLNGILIEPNEEFSLVQALGSIDAANGYLPELVIKGNKTIPEYGGGLCQIGTTAFRAAVDAGFPITERKNHSYRVSYYEPAGTDATIYDPRPDFRFINDTGNYVLFTTEISGNDLIFSFYGTPDGRMVEYTQPRIYNFVQPGPTKLVETTDLAPGQKKCTERAHTGADAEFTRTITYADGEQKIDVFSSHYKPWQEVCLIGVESLSEDTES